MVRIKQKISYIFIFFLVSLYPWVLFSQDFPIGPPVIIHNNFQDISEYWGLVQCVVLPNRDNFLPVLPMKSKDKKLIFTNCATCANSKNKNNCICPDRNRAFHGVFTTFELQKALEMGTKIVEICCVWHFEPHSRSKTLFSEYLKHWFAIKLKASGLPEQLSESEKQNFVQETNSEFDLNLTTSDFEKNPGLR